MLQLTLDAAQKYSDHAGVKNLTEESLYRPEVSIAIGCEYLGQLSRMFAGLPEAYTPTGRVVGADLELGTLLLRGQREDLGKPVAGSPAGCESVHLTDYPTVDESLIDNELSQDMDAVLRIVSLGGAARNAAKRFFTVGFNLFAVLGLFLFPLRTTSLFFCHSFELQLLLLLQSLLLLLEILFDDAPFDLVGRPTEGGRACEVWAVTPEGGVRNLAEVVPGTSDRAHLHVSTELQAFGMVVTAEPSPCSSGSSDEKPASACRAVRSARRSRP